MPAVTGYAPRILAGVALLLGGLAAMAGSPRKEAGARVDVLSVARTVETEDDQVAAIELAGWIKEGRNNLRIIDVRDAAAFDQYHIPRAERIALDSLVTTPFKPDETLVLYSEGGAHAAQGWVFLKALGYKRVYYLRGGVAEWLDEVMNPTIVVNASNIERARFDSISEISRYFGGLPRAGASGTDKSANAARTRRRGC